MCEKNDFFAWKNYTFHKKLEMYLCARSNPLSIEKKKMTENFVKRKYVHGLQFAPFSCEWTLDMESHVAWKQKLLTARSIA